MHETGRSRSDSDSKNPSDPRKEIFRLYAEDPVVYHIFQHRVREITSNSRSSDGGYFETPDSKPEELCHRRWSKVLGSCSFQSVNDSETKQSNCNALKDSFAKSNTVELDIVTASQYVESFLFEDLKGKVRRLSGDIVTEINYGYARDSKLLVFGVMKQMALHRIVMPSLDDIVKANPSDSETEEPLYAAAVHQEINSPWYFTMVKDGASSATYTDEVGEEHVTQEFFVLALRHDPIDLPLQDVQRRAGAKDPTGPVF
ncbi:hypothetical protein SCHPADRAFT_892822 [Schizopora paradoxa]|uniref:Uncharacterized protein n=1 Tax=Schizopora paradoxa TaxID=27342 RepID=A0A0H2RK23_9AGAM|nr:hypothetical protein SCHPADRAFT_892822 [Schizopora paradoxa]